MEGFFADTARWSNDPDPRSGLETEGFIHSPR